MVVEIQALVVKSEALQPRRSITGLVPARVHQILGILERHAGYPMRSHEVYVSVMGGIRVTEPAADLPVALAIASAHRSVPLGQTAAWGEMGLTGDVRPASRPAVRTAEVERVASGAVIAPAHGYRSLVDALAAVEGLR
jgi:DNA repair protein RadA/Sms